MSTTSVPCPGNSGSSTLRPASARARASPRIDCGLPVNPCRTSAPRTSPAAEYGSAPGRTGALTRGHVTGEPTIVPPISGIPAQIRRSRTWSEHADDEGASLMPYPFLSDEWLEEARKIRAEYEGKG